MMECYLDNSATTRVDKEVAALINKIMLEDYGNPSSLHSKGFEAEKYIREAKKTFADLLRCKESEIYFTSGGTESDNLALTGTFMANMRRGDHIITTRIEHPAVAQTAAFLETVGARVDYLDVDSRGHIDPAQLESLLDDKTILVSVMHVNNEIGALEPVKEIGELIHDRQPECLFHVDDIQGFGKVRLIPKECHVDMLSVSSHKIHGPKGVGALYIRKGVSLMPFMLGGGQEKGMRSGTENVPGIAGMAKAAEILYDRLDEDVAQLYACKKHFIEGVSKIEGVQVNGLPMNGQAGGQTGGSACGACIEQTAPHVVSVSFAGVRSEVLLHTLEDAGIYVSAGSACSAHKPQPSATLKAMGVDASLLTSTIRFSFSVFTTMEELDYTLQILYDKIPVLRRYTRRA